MRRAGRSTTVNASSGGRKSPRPIAVGLSLLAVAALLVVVGVRAGGETADPLGAPQVILEDTFDGGDLDASVWNRCHWWDDDGCTIASNKELEWYRPEQVSVVDGAWS